MYTKINNGRQLDCNCRQFVVIFSQGGQSNERYLCFKNDNKRIFYYEGMFRTRKNRERRFDYYE